MRVLSCIVQITGFGLPWRLRRVLLCKLLSFDIAITARIGFTIILADKVALASGVHIGHFNVIKGLSQLIMGEFSSIGQGNWITGFPIGISAHFANEHNRDPSLVMQVSSAVTSRHIIDCTNRVLIGRYTTIAGFRSQILTHSIDVNLGRQTSSAVEISEYCFVGSGVIILPGARLPAKCVLGAGSVLTRAFGSDHEGMLLAGMPAQPKCKLQGEGKYFDRESGYVW